MTFITFLINFVSFYVYPFEKRNKSFSKMTEFMIIKYPNLLSHPIYLNQPFFILMKLNSCEMSIMSLQFLNKLTKSRHIF